MFQHLKPQLLVLLPAAKNIYIATALVKKAGYQLIENLLPPTCKRYYLVGTSLPSGADVLQALFDMPKDKGCCKVYDGNETYHPKVYLVELNSGEYVGLIGSANTTHGGLETNIEMSLRTDDQPTCIQLYDWFQGLFNNASELSQPFIDAWRKAIKHANKRQAASISDLSQAKNFLKTKEIPVRVSTNQFFGPAHYQAYQHSNWEDYSEAANQRRKSVQDRFKILHKEIYPEFASYGLTGLSPHYHPANRVSHYQYRKNFTNHLQRSMWLHYGYSQPELGKGGAFGSHPRIQVILHEHDLGIWLVVGVNNGSYKERQNFKRNLGEVPFFDQLVFNLVTELGNDYWINMNGKTQQVSDFTSTAALKTFLLKDNLADYFIFGRTYQPNDGSLSDDNIAETVLLEFQRLHDLYQLFKKIN